MSVLYSLPFGDMAMTMTKSGTIAFPSEQKRYIRACDALCGSESRAGRLLKGGPSVRRCVEALVRAVTPDWFDAFSLAVSHASLPANHSASTSLNNYTRCLIILPPQWYERIYQTGKAVHEGKFVIEENAEERYTLGWAYRTYAQFWDFSAHWTNLRP